MATTEVLTDRWAFTQNELSNPHNCTADDLFMADLLPEEESDEPGQILVNRRGEVLKNHGNGTYDVVIEMRDDIDLDVLFKDSDDTESAGYMADEWRTVIIDENGKFLSFQKDDVTE